MNFNLSAPNILQAASPSSIVHSIGRGLDDAQAALPPVPRNALRLVRSSVERLAATADSVGSAVVRRVSPAADTATTAAATASGQARSAAARTARTASRSAKESIGQARAQTARTGREASTAAAALLDEGARGVGMDDKGRPAQLEKWTREQLYERAQEIGISGRSSMNKSELVAAIRTS